MTSTYDYIVNDNYKAYKEYAAALENCEWCEQDLSELKSPNCQELCVDCTGESEEDEE